eukprot:10970173-Alexandrium_andersonii.AAC.1
MKAKSKTCAKQVRLTTAVGACCVENAQRDEGGCGNAERQGQDSDVRGVREQRKQRASGGGATA